MKNKKHVLLLSLISRQVSNNIGLHIVILLVIEKTK